MKCNIDKCHYTWHIRNR